MIAVGVGLGLMWRAPKWALKLFPRGTIVRETPPGEWTRAALAVCGLGIGVLGLGMTCMGVAASRMSGPSLMVRWLAAGIPWVLLGWWLQ